MSQVSIQPLHPCLVALQTATGAVTFLVTRHPAVQLEHLGMQLEVARRLVITTPHAAWMADELRAQFAGDRSCGIFGDRPYYSVDWEDVEAAIADFDPATGKRLRLADVSVGDQVQVELSTVSRPDRKERGEVTAISGARYRVKFPKPIGDMVGIWAPRALIKPVRRACALVGVA